MPAPATLQRLQRVHDARPLVFWGLVVLAIGAVLGIGAALAPQVVVEDFLWTNFWGPTLADARQESVERFGIRATEDYTLTSELVYGAILAGALYSIYAHIFRKPGLVCDGRFILALTPYILFGPVGRVLEDANTFCRAGTDCDPSFFAYPFISPLIYVFDAAIVVANILIMRRAARLGPVARARAVGAALAVQLGVYGFVVSAWPAEFSHHLAPVYFAAIVLAAYAVYLLGEARRWNPFRTGLF
ncbi:MAG: DUF63 family protein, partial [bacterium]